MSSWGTGEATAAVPVGPRGLPGPAGANGAPGVSPPLATIAATITGTDTTQPAHSAGVAAAIDGNAGLRVTPERFGALGDGVAIDTAAVIAAAAESTAQRRPLYLARIYRVAPSATIVFTEPVEGPGKIVVANATQSFVIAEIASRPEDIEDVPLATVNAWTGLYRGSTQITGLTERDWCYTIDNPNKWIINRAGSATSIAEGETFYTLDDAGRIAPPIVRDWTLPLTAGATCVRRRIRSRQVFTLRIEMDGAGTGEAAGLLRVTRPNTEVRGSAVNSSAGAVRVAVTTDDAALVNYASFFTGGMRVNATNYGFNANRSAAITYTDCVASFCRRGIDNHAAKNILINAGMFPDGVGGHWVDGMLIRDAYLSSLNPLNPRPIMVAGSNVVAEGCTIVLPIDGDVLRMRDDFPELSGEVAIRGGRILFDATGGGITAAGVKGVNLGSHAAYDSGRAALLPSLIEFSPDLVECIGGGDYPIMALVVGAQKTAAEFPRDMIASGAVRLNVGKWQIGTADKGDGTPRIGVNLLRAETQIGDGYDCDLRLPRAALFIAPTTGVAAHSAAGRYRVRLDAMDDAHVITARARAVQSLRVSNASPRTTISSAAGATPLGDELADIDRGSLPILINGFGQISQAGNGLSIADGAYACPDQWIALCDGGSVTSAVATISGASIVNLHQWQQPDASPKRIGFAQIIESGHVQRLRGNVCSMMAAALCSQAGKTLRYAVLEWTGTANQCSRDPINDWASTNYTAGNFFKTGYAVLAMGDLVMTATLQPAASLSFQVGTSATNLIVAFWSETLDQNAYIRAAADLRTGWPTLLDDRSEPGAELQRCRSFYAKRTVATINGTVLVTFAPEMIGPVTVTASVGTVANTTPNGTALTHSAASTSVVTADARIGV